jgi:predicted DNA-binding transcriptional regulator AlpA
MMNLMTEHQVAELLGVSVATIRKRRLLRQRPTFLKIGARVLYRPEEVRDFIESAAAGKDR